ncbi:phosphatidate cytidylyltransferase [Phaeobacter inhibens]|uniref:phosphatidate cytidylyltransferase n=1 Tax=Phaeobacter inhibens TaxID=221822 RepID=UPI00076BAFB3|nr:phosphatidate cytidylyltransferase [Phaeobacter inhibens]KXF90219.1 phosphatidate cytidylyltransferase [Phaeobacter inhibens]WHP70051.1 phosphatidate cytidylyltransferase [Phaeobacter inhibens]
MSGAGRWADLMPRVISAIVMIVVGGWAVWRGGVVFDLLIAAACGGMIWELLRMVVPDRQGLALPLGVLSMGAVLAAALMGGGWALNLLLIPAVLGAVAIDIRRGIYIGFALWVLFATYAFIWMRSALGLDWMIWLISVVVATDIAGYFAGKTFGGPKFWPRVSPKKTWSGTSAGWIAAAAVGAVFAMQGGLGFGVVLLSVLVSMASQAGDVAESALKRKMAVKDSSGLIPGHGGLFDRFDGMLGAAAMVLLVLSLWGLPGGTI